MGIDHPLFRIDRLQRLELAAQLGPLRRSPVGAVLRLASGCRGCCGCSRQGLLAWPSRASSAASFPSARDVAVDRGDALARRRRRDRVADERGFLALARRDRDARILDQRRRRALADRDARARGIEQADRLVRQAAGPECSDARGCTAATIGGIGNANAVVLLHRRKKAAQHDRSRSRHPVRRSGSAGSDASAPDPFRCTGGIPTRWSRRSCAACRGQAGVSGDWRHRRCRPSRRRRSGYAPRR